MRLHYKVALPFFLLILCSCATLGIEAPKNVSDRIAYVTSGADALVVSTTNALSAHTISSADAEYVSTAGRGLSGLAAAAAADPDPTSAANRLALAESILKQLSAYVASHQKVKP